MLSLSLCRLDFRRHRPLAARNARIGAKGVDLIPLQFRVFLSCRSDDDSPLRVDRVGHLVSLLRGIAEQLPQHDLEAWNKELERMLQP